MKAFRSRQFAASRQPEGGEPVTGRWQRNVDDCCHPRIPPRSSPLIRHSDELYCGTESLQDIAFGRTHGRRAARGSFRGSYSVAMYRRCGPMKRSCRPAAVPAAPLQMKPQGPLNGSV
jgi:hypothetical protein